MKTSQDLATHRRITADKRFLLIPVCNGAPITRITVIVNGQRVHFFDARLATGDTADWWASFDISAWLGTIIEVSISSGTLDSLITADTPAPLENVYCEPNRPQYHFSAKRGWVNDPNGMVYHNGEWHLFFQYNPYGIDSENKAWGHAVSTDLVHWKELPVAMLPRIAGGPKGQVYSGSAVIDKHNTADFGAGAMIAVYTDTQGAAKNLDASAIAARANCAEVIAVSNDNGRTFHYYKENPIYIHEGRDPKVFWHEKTQRWVMVVWEQTQDGQRIFQIHTSKNLKQWTRQSEIAGFDLYECPELFELSVDGDPSRTAWVMLEANSCYLTGDFDGRIFTPFEKQKIQADYGDHCYAAQTFNDAPDGRRIAISWARKVCPSGESFAGAMSVPMELSLRQTESGLRLCHYPVREIETLRHAPRQFFERVLGAGETLLAENTGASLDIEATLNIADGDMAGLLVHGVSITFDSKNSVLHCGKKRDVPLPCTTAQERATGTRRIKLRVLIDHGMMEVFLNNGLAYLSLYIAGDAQSHEERIALTGTGKGSMLTELIIYEMKSIW